MNPEFRTDISSVGRYGMHRDTQFISDFLIHLAIGYAPDNFFFALAQHTQLIVLVLIIVFLYTLTFQQRSQIVFRLSTEGTKILLSISK